MHKLSSSFVLGYHGCDQLVAEKLISGTEFRRSENAYDWLGHGTYFWEANPVRGIEFARELQKLKRGPTISNPAVVGAVIDLGFCLDLTTSAGLQEVGDTHKELVRMADEAGYELPRNDGKSLRRNLDCFVVETLHDARKERGLAALDTVRAVFIEGAPLYPDSGFCTKTHIQICVCNPECIKGVFRVPGHQLK